MIEIRSLRATVRSWLIGADGFFLGDTDLLLPRVRVEIIAVATGEPLSKWKLRTPAATDLKAKIERDLDEKDAEEFAAEWGLPTSTDGSAKDQTEPRPAHRDGGEL